MRNVEKSKSRNIARAPVAGFLSLSLALFASSTALAQPSLFPPGPPTTPSGRMGVRTEIQALPYVITSPGSYYISMTLFQTIAGSPGITIDASEVTIDLMGFGLIGLGAPGDDAITLGPGMYRDITVHSGYVAFWGGDGLDLDAGGGGPIPVVHVWEVSAYSNGGEGIAVGTSSILRHVFATYNTLDGIRTDRNCKLTNCVSTLNGSAGITTGPGCHISDSVAGWNGLDGIVLGANSTLVASTACTNGANGVMLAMACRVTDCVASENGFTAGTGSGFFAIGPGNNLGGCTAFNNFNSGFESLIMPPFGGTSAQDCSSTSNGFASGIGDGFTNLRTITDCTASGNFDNGIETFSSGHIFRNTCAGNGANGIEAVSDGNVIEENHVYSNTALGITTLANPGPMGNLATRNRAHANGAAYAFAPFDTIGLAIVGPAVLGIVGAHMANIAY